jgi:uncharacterized membrane protein
MGSMPVEIFSIIAIAASFVALSLSLLLLLVGKSGRKLPGCGANSGCEKIVRGRWSRGMEIPVAALAVVVYLAGVFFSLAVNMTSHSYLEWEREILQFLAIVMAGSAIWFTALQALLLRRYCIYCILIHACGLVSATSIFARYPIWPIGGHVVPVAIGISALAMLISGQLLFPSKTFAVESSGPVECAPRTEMVPESPTNPVVPRASARALTHRKATLLSGKIVLDLDAWPLFGETTAPQVEGKKGVRSLLANICNYVWRKTPLSFITYC